MSVDLPNADDYRDAVDGGPAFPKVPDDSRNGSAGMSLRDWFAGQALAGLMSNHSIKDGFWKAKTAAVEAYSFADAMLVARSASSVQRGER